jgi:hypothetical protein
MWRLVRLTAALMTLAAPALAHDSPRMLADAEMRWAAQLALLERASLDRPQLVASRALVQRSWLWRQPRITVCFGPSSDVDRHLDFVRQIRDVANEWLAQARTKFDFGSERLRRCDEPGASRSDMRVYVARSASQAYYGMLGNTGRDNDVTGFPGYSVVLSFPDGPTHEALMADRPVPGSVNWRFYVLHEFGHALGFLHEHQRVDCGYDENWLKTRRNPPYSADFVSTQIRPSADPIAAYPADVVYQTRKYLGTRYDNDSVMQYYESDAEAFRDRERSPCYRSAPVFELSRGDRFAASIAYDGTNRDPGLEVFVTDPDTGAPIAVSDNARRVVLEALAVP